MKGVFPSCIYWCLVSSSISPADAECHPTGEALRPGLTQFPVCKVETALLWPVRLELLRKRATKQKGQAEPEPGYVVARERPGKKVMLTARCSFVLVTCLQKSLLQAAESHRKHYGTRQDKPKEQHLGWQLEKQNTDLCQPPGSSPAASACTRSLLKGTWAKGWAAASDLTAATCAQWPQKHLQPTVPAAQQETQLPPRIVES